MFELIGYHFLSQSYPLILRCKKINYELKYIFVIFAFIG